MSTILLIDLTDLNFESTGDTLSESSCTNSILTQDKSAYWAPWLYFEHDNGTFEDVKLALGLTAYVSLLMLSPKETD